MLRSLGILDTDLESSPKLDLGCRWVVGEFLVLEGFSVG